MPDFWPGEEAISCQMLDVGQEENADSALKCGTMSDWLVALVSE
jgi:hypothetical protein